LAALAALALATTSGCGTPAGSPGAGGDGQAAQIMASFYPLQWLTGRIAGEDHPVGSLTPAGAEPHDSELELSQVSALSGAKLLVTIDGFQAAVDDAVQSSPPGEVLDVGAEVGLVDSDPHFWLDPVKFSQAVDPIAEALGRAYPDQEQDFLDRAAAVKDELAELDSELAEALAPYQGAYLVTTHAAFNYFGARYSLNPIAVVGIDPEVEPTPSRIAEVRDQLGTLPVETIFFEEFASPKTAEVLANDLGIRSARINPVETGVSGDYPEAMRSNLAALTEGLVAP
jgi:zinc transport system substrate-binding protein